MLIIWHALTEIARTHASTRHVALMLIVKLKITELDVIAKTLTKETLIRNVDKSNVKYMTTVQIIWHVEMKSVSILVIVHQMPFAM